MIEGPASEVLSNADAWRKLHAELRPYVARRVRRPADADDVLQDILLRVVRGLPSLRDDQRFGPWVYRIAHRAVVDHARGRPREVDEKHAPEPTDDAPLLPEPDAHAEAANTARLFVHTLPSPYREALTLTELQGLSQVEAARQLGISVSGMKSRVQRGRRLLRKTLEDCCHFALDARRRVVDVIPREDGKLPDNCCVDDDADDAQTRETM